jgi:hypothetical protein
MSDTNTPHPSKPKRTLRPFREAKPLPPDHPIYQEGPRFGFVRALPHSIEALRAHTPTPSRRKLTPEERQQELERLGFKNGNKTQGGPTAFELPTPDSKTHPDSRNPDETEL